MAVGTHLLTEGSESDDIVHFPGQVFIPGEAFSQFGKFHQAGFRFFIEEADRSGKILDSFPEEGPGKLEVTIDKWFSAMNQKALAVYLDCSKAVSRK